MASLIGQTVSHYCVVEKIGEGGMGVVYKADDLTLTRAVALKFLPHGLHSDELERARFLQEARAAAILNHPNICTIHDILDIAGERCIVMEFVDGRTLKQTAPVQNLRQAVDWAIQIAGALQEAHVHGIVHRDVKSENIMVNAKNQVKVMDFGLAKLRGSLKLTRTSSTVGTLSYMAPEQIQGGEADPRSDIFSFGIVLYEMVAGHLPFGGVHESAVMYAIVNEEPAPVEQYRTDLSAEFLHVLSRSLEKRPEDRYQSVGDMLIDLRRLKKETSRVFRPSLDGRLQSAGDGGGGGTPSVGPPRSPRRLSSKTLTAAIVVVTAAIVAGAWFLVVKPKPGRDLPFARKQLTFLGNISMGDLSPDGKSFAYINDKGQVFVKDIGGGQALEVFKAEDCTDIRWSPTGAEFSVIGKAGGQGYRMFVIPRFGGPARSFKTAALASWSPDGSRIAGIRGATPLVTMVNVSTGDSTGFPLTASRIFNHSVDWSPQGNLLIYETHNGEGTRFSIAATTPDGVRQFRILEDSVSLEGVRWDAAGDAIYYLRGNIRSHDLMKISVDPGTGSPRGSPRRVLNVPQTHSISVSRDCRRMLAMQEQVRSNLWSGRFDAQRGTRVFDVQQMTRGTSEIYGFNLSPDGNRVAFARLGQGGFDIYTAPVSGGESHQITFDGAYFGGPVWAPDGKSIACAAFKDGVPRVCVVGSEGGAPRVYAKTVTTLDGAITWAPGHSIIYGTPGNRNFHVLDPATESEHPLVPNDSVGWMFDPHVSRDGAQVVVHWNRDPRGIWVVSLRDGGGHFVSGVQWTPVGWSGDGKSLYAFRREGTPAILDIALGPGKLDPS